MSALKLVRLKKGDESLREILDGSLNEIYTSNSKNFRFSHLACGSLPQIDEGNLSVVVKDKIPFGYAKFYIHEGIDIKDFIDDQLDYGDFSFFVSKEGKKIYPYQAVEMMGLKNVKSAGYLSMIESFGPARGIAKMLINDIKSFNSDLILLHAQPFTGCELFYKGMGFTNSGLYAVNDDFNMDIIKSPDLFEAGELEEQLECQFPMYFMKSNEK